MDGELASRLEAVLSDPEQMAKLTEAAKGLFAQMPAAGQEPRDETPPPAAPAQPDAKFLAAIGKAFAGSGDKSRSTALLLAMRPYMKPEKQEKLDRALQIARMAHIAGAVMKEYGGDSHGL